jgi:hypothetical protein
LKPAKKHWRGEDQTMTARSLLDRRIRKVYSIIFLGIALFVSAIFAHEALGVPDWVWVPGLIGFAVAWITMAGAYWFGFFQCPYCQGKLTGLVMHSGRLRLDPRIRFCPYCGQDLDTEAPEEKL